MTAERYTAVFTGAFEGREPGEYAYLTMSDDPLGLDGSYTLRRGRPPYGTLGREVAFDKFPEGCRRVILEIYRRLWDLKEEVA